MMNLLMLTTLIIGVMSLTGYIKYVKYIISIRKELDITGYFEFFIVSIVCILVILMLLISSFFYFKSV